MDQFPIIPSLKTRPCLPWLCSSRTASIHFITTLTAAEEASIPGPIEDTMSPSINGSIETPPRASSPVHNFGTLAVHAGSPHDPSTGAVIEAVGCLSALLG